MRFNSWFFVCALLTACAGEDSRYHDTSALERPPTLAIEKRDVPFDEAGNSETPGAPETIQSDESQDSEDESPKRGLGDRVSITESHPPEIRIRQSFDIAWNTLNQALTQRGIEIVDREHDRGRYYVRYDADAYVSDHGSLLDKSFGLFSDEYDEQPYILIFSAEDSETKISAVPFKDAEKRKRMDRDDASSDEPEDITPDKPNDGAEKLLRSIYLTLHDELRETP